jgi:hypothetical protein
MFRISKIIAADSSTQAIYLKGVNYLTNGEKKGSLTFCWENKRAGLTGPALYYITGLSRKKFIAL